ncbi:VOC family protein [bacterium]|nr:VOC family protein [bacterium]
MFVKGLDHISIIVSDVEENLRFYRDILGFNVLKDFYDEKEKARIIFLNVGNNMLELIAPDEKPTKGEKVSWEKRSKGGVEHIAFLVDDMDRTYEYLKSRGIEFILGPLEFSEGKYGYFYGPEGVLLEVIWWKT